MTTSPVLALQPHARWLAALRLLPLGSTHAAFTATGNRTSTSGPLPLPMPLPLLLPIPAASFRPSPSGSRAVSPRHCHYSPLRLCKQGLQLQIPVPVSGPAPRRPASGLHCSGRAWVPCMRSLHRRALPLPLLLPVSLRLPMPLPLVRQLPHLLLQQGFKVCKVVKPIALIL